MMSLKVLLGGNSVVALSFDRCSNLRGITADLAALKLSMEARYRQIENSNPNKITIRSF